MAKIIFLVLVLLVAYAILKNYRKSVDRREPPPPVGGAEDMVRCTQCGVHLPRSESVTTGGEFYCSIEHQRLHRHPG